MRLRPVLAIVVCAVVVSTVVSGVAMSSPAAAGVPRVTIDVLPAPAGTTGVQVTDVNARGQISGTVTTTADGGHAVRWDGRRRTDLSTDPLTSSEGSRINDAGTVAGATTDPRPGYSGLTRVWAADGTFHDCVDDRPLFWPAVVAVNSRGEVLSRALAVAYPGTTVCDAAGHGTRVATMQEAYALDDQGRLAGDGFVPDGTIYKYAPLVRQADGSIVTLPAPEHQSAAASDFGPGDTIVGSFGILYFDYHSNASYVPQHAVRWSGGQYVELGDLGGGYSIPLTGGRSINRIGDIVGRSQTTTADWHAFRWRHGRMTDLGTLGGPTSTASAVNDRGQVVGTSTLANGDEHAFVWSNGRMTDLGTLGGPTSAATDINDRGQIVGIATRPDGSTRPVVWTLH
jgi:probable HAF family extracellular repeat protein